MKTVCLLVSLFVLATSAGAQREAPVVQTIDPALQPKTQCLNPEYLSFMPAEGIHEKMPLLIYLHGAGGVGGDIHRIQGQVRPLWQGVQTFGKGPCIVVAPQCLKQTREGERGTWLPEDLNVLLQHVQATLPVDPARIYLTGNSMGGYGSWVWGGHYPEHFAAIAPVVGGIGRGGPKEVTPKLEKWAANLAKVPVYAFAGAKDKVVPAERSERMVAAIRKAGGKEIQLKIYPEEGHNARRVVYATAEFYDWMFSKKNPLKPHARQ